MTIISLNTTTCSFLSTKIHRDTFLFWGKVRHTLDDYTMMLLHSCCLPIKSLFVTIYFILLWSANLLPFLQENSLQETNTNLDFIFLCKNKLNYWNMFLKKKKPKNLLEFFRMWPYLCGSSFYYWRRGITIVIKIVIMY